MSNRITKRNDSGRPQEMRCDCGATLEFGSPGSDIECQKCGTEYNSAGQKLAPREFWGEETGETAADYFAGFNNPERAFDEQ